MWTHRPHMVNVQYNSKKEQWRGSIAYMPLINWALCHVRPLPTTDLLSLEDDSNAQLIFSAGADPPSAEPEEMDSEDDNDDDTKNERGQLEKRWMDPIHLYVEALNKGDHHLSVIYMIRRLRSVEEMTTYPCGKVTIYMPVMQNEWWAQEKRNMAALTHQFKIVRVAYTNFSKWTYWPHIKQKKTNARETQDFFFFGGD